MSERHISVIEFVGFETEDDVQQFFDEILKDYQWGKGQYVQISNLNKKGVKKMDKHVFKKEETE